jgi:hypothetical protein
MIENTNKISSLSYKRIKRIEIRKKARSYKNIWSKDESELDTDNNTVEEIMNNFIKVKNYLLGLEKSHVINNQEDQSDSFSINSNIDSDNELDNEKPITLIPVQEKTKYLNKKVHREGDIISEEIDNEDNQENPLTESLESEEESIGPQPIKIELDKKEEKRFYAGTSINRDEAQKYAHYVQQGKRIPRRGEVGLSSEEIEKYESLGYVMSGLRHKKMTMARLKKEQQVYTAEEKRALAIYNLEEQLRKERNIINEMKKWKSDKDEEIRDK